MAHIICTYLKKKLMKHELLLVLVSNKRSICISYTIDVCYSFIVLKPFYVYKLHGSTITHNL